MDPDFLSDSAGIGNSPRNAGSGDSEESSAEISQHGEARVCIEPVPRRLRRPHEYWATRSWALLSLHRMGARPDGRGLRILRNRADSPARSPISISRIRNHADS